jgi:MFS family permease
MQAIMPILGWRWLLALSSTPCFILLIFSSVIPESPRYLCARGKISEAMLVLERIARMNNKALPPGTVTSEPKRIDDNYDLSVTTVLLMTEDRFDDDTSTKSNSKNIFKAFWSRDLIRPTLLLWLVHFASYFAYYGVVYLISELSSGRSQPKDSSLYRNVLVTSFAGNIVC